MPDISAILALPYIQPAQAQKHVTHNEALRILDAVVQLSVADRTLTTPPGSPAEGDRYIVAEGGISAWAGQDTRIAVFGDGGWWFIAPLPGWRAHVLAEGQDIVFDGSAWQAGGGTIESTAKLGINATADDTNRLVVSSPAVLLNHAGAGHQVKINKATATDTASLLFQTGYSGRAEMGLAGSDGFAVKVSPDGAAWNTGLGLDPGGVASLLDGASIGGHAAFHRGNVLGTVSQSGGVPTGAIVERGSNANGDFIRFADGTQFCTCATLSAASVSTAAGSLFRSADVSWTFAAAFVAAPTVTAAVDATDCWATSAAPSATAVVLRALAYASKGSSQTLRAMAVGRWF